MIKLDTPFQTVQSLTFNGQTITTTTDTLFISSVRIDFNTGAIYATIQKGTGDTFIDTLPPIDIVVNPDGSFGSSDHLWTGSVPAAIQLVEQLRTTFDQFILSSGKVTGKLV